MNVIRAKLREFHLCVGTKFTVRQGTSVAPRGDYVGLFFQNWNDMYVWKIIPGRWSIMSGLVYVVTLYEISVEISVEWTSMEKKHSFGQPWIISEGNGKRSSESNHSKICIHYFVINYRRGKYHVHKLINNIMPFEETLRKGVYQKKTSYRYIDRLGNAKKSKTFAGDCNCCIWPTGCI